MRIVAALLELAIATILGGGITAGIGIYRVGKLQKKVAAACKAIAQMTVRNEQTINERI